jgi:hypothetical protein
MNNEMLANNIEKEPAVSHQLGCLEESTTVVAKLIAELEQRLIPVTAGKVPPHEKISEDMQSMCPIATRLYAVSSQLMVIRETILELSERIEV